MEKILLASTNTLRSKQSTDFADFVSRLTHSKLLSYVIPSGDDDERIDALLKNTRFADLLIIDQPLLTETESGLLKRLLTRSECPVIVAPKGFNGINEIVFAYDGSASSVFAIKQFSYLFPELADLKITVLHVSNEEAPIIIEKKKILELLQMHYLQIGYCLISGKADEGLCNYLMPFKDAFVVMGAFGPNKVSGYFRRSTAELVLEKVNLPVFIAHH